MKKAVVLPLFGAALLLFLSSGGLWAQELVFNGDFETANFTSLWRLTGGNTHTTIASFQTVLGVPSLCVKRRPGTPNNNGAMEQNVHLMAGVTYHFQANIAAYESG